MTLRFGSLFAGIGGFDLGLERAGMECVWQVEIDDYCTKVLEKHWPDVTRYRDIKDVDGKELEPVDLICGGFPCQPYSLAGKRRGKKDDRNLWPEFIRIIRELRPIWIVAENVKGIISLYLDQVLSDLEGEGYTCWTFNLPAVAFDALHRRERIYVLAHSASKQCNPRAKISGKFQGMPGNKQINDHSYRSGENVAYSNSKRLQAQREQKGIQEEKRKACPGAKRGSVLGKAGIETWWTVEPGLGRVANGIPDRVDRIKGLGNAVVPQVAEWIGKRILECC